MVTLFSWIGLQDEKAILDNKCKDCALGSILAHKEYDRLELLIDYRNSGKKNLHSVKKQTELMISLLSKEFNCEIVTHYEPIENPTDFSDIYKATKAILDKYPYDSLATKGIDLNTTSGTPTMQMVWLLLSKTMAGRPLSTSLSGGVNVQDFPFEIRAEFIPEKAKNEIKELAITERNKVMKQVTFEQFKGYKKLAFSTEAMVSLYKEAIRAGSHEMPVCITGEPGTEKKAIARLIHNESNFSNAPFINFDCRTVEPFEIDDLIFDPRNLSPRKALIKRAEFGTLYLENIENLRLSSQRKLVEIITESETNFLGSGSKLNPIKKVRLIFSTKLNLEELMRNGIIDEEFYFLISSSRIRIPSIEEREGDTLKIASEMLRRVNLLLTESVGFGEKKFSQAALKFIEKKRWPGNVYELYTTIKRAALSTEGPVIMYDDLVDAVISTSKENDSDQDILNQRLGEGFDVNKVLKEVRKHYVYRALEQANNQKNKAADLLGLLNRQTLTHWLDRFEEEDALGK